MFLKYKYIEGIAFIFVPSFFNHALTHWPHPKFPFMRKLFILLCMINGFSKSESVGFEKSLWLCYLLPTQSINMYRDII